MDEDTQNLNDLLLGDTPAEEVTEEATTEALPQDEDTDQSDSDSDDSEVESTDESDEEESDEDESEEEEPELSDTAKLTKAVRAEREERKADREKFRSALEEYQALINDPNFLATQYEKLQEKAQNPEPVQADIPNAPAYPNTAYGQSKMEADQVLATSILPEALTNDTLNIMVQSLVSNRQKPMTYIEAAEKVRDTLGLKEKVYRTEGRKEGKEATEKVLAKRSKMSTETRPRAGSATKTQNLEKRMNSDNRRTRETGIAESLGLI